MSKEKEKYVPLRDLEAKLVLPGGAPLGRRSWQLRMEKLGIVPVDKKVEGSPWAVSHVTEAQALLLEKDFKQSHWRKFKAAGMKWD